MKFDRRQLMVYAVTDRAWTGKMSLCEQVEAALKGGATMVQMREKGLTNDTVQDYLEEARSLRALTERYKVPLIIDDNIKLALLCGADGVHVGQSDIKGRNIRAMIGPDRILGISAGTVEEARAAEKAGADYIGVGAVFGTSTKKDARNLSVEKLREISASVSIPVVAIGGINRSNVGELSGSDVDGIAVISALFGAERPGEAAAELAELAKEIRDSE